MQEQGFLWFLHFVFFGQRSTKTCLNRLTFSCDSVHHLCRMYRVSSHATVMVPLHPYLASSLKPLHIVLNATAHFIFSTHCLKPYCSFMCSSLPLPLLSFPVRSPPPILLINALLGLTGCPLYSLPSTTSLSSGAVPSKLCLTLCTLYISQDERKKVNARTQICHLLLKCPVSGGLMVKPALSFPPWSCT